MSTAIEGWKVYRVLKPVCVWHMGLPWAETALTKKTDGSSSKTDEVDAVGFYYLSLALYPLVTGWAIYSLLYQQHKSWWSWVINALANGVYTFGFIAMTPQLFVNYKFKSVAHLPWKVFMYKVRYIYYCMQQHACLYFFLCLGDCRCDATVHPTTTATVTTLTHQCFDFRWLVP